MMIPSTAVVVVALAALVTWSAVLIRNWQSVVTNTPVPVGVRLGFIVAVMTAVIGGQLTSFGFLGWLSLDATTMIGAAWRAGVLAAGLYALVASHPPRSGSGTGR